MRGGAVDVDADVLVVGGGPVGLATAIEARLAGLRVAVLERRDGTIDKACGEGLMPGALAALDRWGVAAAGVPIAGFRYTDGRRSVAHRFGGAQGRGVRRTELHRAFAERAAALGVQMQQATVGGIEQGAGSVRAGGVTARYLVAADGLHSDVRRVVGLGVPSNDGRRFGLRRHFQVAPWSDLVEVHWRRDVELYVTPVGDDVVGVAVLGPKGTDFAATVAGCAEVADHLRGAAPVDAVRGAGPLRQRVARRASGRIALVGDAAGYVDALTGEGLAVGFASAQEVVAAILRDDLASYDARWRAVTRAPRLMTEGVLRLATSPLRPAVVPIAAALPAAFGAAIELLARPASTRPAPHPVHPA